MLAQNEIDNIRRLYFEEKQPIKKIANQLGIARNTVRRWIRKESSVPVYGEKRSFLIEHKEEIRQAFLDCEGNCLPLRRKIRNDYQITIHLRMLERFCEEFRREIKESLEPTTRFETLPGQQLQIDFGEKKMKIGGKEIKVHIFVAKLGFSRRIFAKAYAAENQDTWLDGIESCFKFFGGVPYSIVSDNSSCLVRNHRASRRKRFTVKYQAFCDYYSVLPIATSIRKPCSKGKVENAVKYVKGNALVGMDHDSIDSLNLWLEKWTLTESDVRVLDEFVPGLKVPIERFSLEKNQLRPLVKPRYCRLREETRRVSNSCLIRIDNDFYRVPNELANKEVQVLISDTTITVARAGENLFELDKATEVYTPPVQPPCTEEPAWQELLARQLEATSAYHNNPLQRPMSFYDASVGSQL